MAVNVDVSNWKLSDGVDFTFPAGTVVPGGGRIVIAADPAALQAQTAFAGALGPWVGNLNNAGERIDLVNHVGRIMDRVNYGDDNKWPVGPDGSGATLAKFNPQSGSEDPASWSTSVQMGGSPGAPNIPPPVTTTETVIMPFSTTWRYNATGTTTLGTAWRDSDYEAGGPQPGWNTGQALLGVEVTPLGEQMRTTFTPYNAAIVTYYFRTTFEFDGNFNGSDVRIRHYVDDGAVFYLNGQEFTRPGMGAGTITPTTLSSAGITDASLSGFTTLPPNLLVTGTNTLAVEVHQNSTTSSDIVFGAEVVLQKTTINPGVGTPTLSLNEIAGALDTTFQVELRNNDTAAQDLAGHVIAATGLSGGEYVIPAQSVPAGGYATFTEAQLGFRPAQGERLFLYAPDKTRVVDAATVRDEARGRAPDGGGRWQFTAADTFGAANSFDFRDEIVINEIMYHDKSTYAKPATYSSSTLIPYTHTWRYNQSGTDLGTAWRESGYDDRLTDDQGAPTGWQEGGGLFYNELASLPAPKTTPLTIGRPTYYFRTTFNLAGDPASAVLQLRHIVDDAAVFYLNGTEFFRHNFFATTNVTYSTNANTAVGDAMAIGPVPLPSHLLVAGTNTLAVETHQIVPASNDVVFGAEVTGLSLVEPGSPYIESSEEWVELYNKSDHAVDLSGWRFDDAIHYDFPQGTTLGAGEYLVVANDPAALAVKFPGVPAIGPFIDGLGNVSDRIALEDPTGNVADEVLYYGGGLLARTGRRRWTQPRAAQPVGR